MRPFSALTLAALIAGASAAMTGPAAAQARFEGKWTILGIDDASPVKEGAEWVGRTIAFNRNAVVAPSPLDCAKPTYEFVRVPQGGLFAGLMSETEAQAFAKRRSLPAETDTLRVSCENGVNDYHVVGQRLVFMLDGVIYVLARAP
ncbi:hypothetical protein [Salinarimonas soli]|uniref:Lipocalin-like domain-containing protein n=1 Tax=Salinarimonas soli TaxID=1638099 RepID=A0A5B2W1W6_9HYPH|nr:hypothetical protein [Salinarimonas soli]KAA2244209.1 hypothetical protein F0L46_00745 [Salinarimonas soli]